MSGDYFTPKESGDLPLKIFKRNEPCSFIPLNDESLAKRCLGLKLIEVELNQAILLLGMIDDCDQPHQSMALWHTSIMSYARCFSKASGRKIKLEETHISGLNAESVSFHREIMSLRNDYVAHSGVNDVDKSIMVLCLSPKSKSRAVENFYYIHLAQMSAHQDAVKKLMRHCEALIPVVIGLRVKTENKYLKIQRSKNVDELYQKSYSSEGSSESAFCVHIS